MHIVGIFFFKRRAAYEVKECDWSSDVCSSDLAVMSDTGVSATWKNAAIRIALKGGCNVMAFPAGCISDGANGLSQLSPPDRPDPSAAAAMPASGEGAARLSAGATPFTAAEGSGQGSWMA